MLYLGVSETHEAQVNIIRALTRKFRLDQDMDLNNFSEQCPLNLTGADFYALCSDAMLGAMSRKARAIDDVVGELHINDSQLNG
jgi:peroxin-6